MLTPIPFASGLTWNRWCTPLSTSPDRSGQSSSRRTFQPIKLRTQILLARAEGRLKEHHSSVTRLEEVVETAREIYSGLHPDLAWALRRLGYSRAQAGDTAGALAAYEESLALYRRLYGRGTRRESAVLRAMLALNSSLGQCDTGRRLAHELIAVAAGEGNASQQGYAKILLAELERNRGNPAEAVTIYQTVLEEFDSQLSASRQARLRSGLGIALLLDDKNAAAERYLSDAFQRHRKVSSAGLQAITQAYYGIARAKNGDLENGLEQARQARLDIEHSATDYHLETVDRLLRSLSAPTDSG